MLFDVCLKRQHDLWNKINLNLSQRVKLMDLLLFDIGCFEKEPTEPKSKEQIKARAKGNQPEKNLQAMRTSNLRDIQWWVSRYKGGSHCVEGSQGIDLAS